MGKPKKEYYFIVHMLLYLDNFSATKSQSIKLNAEDFDGIREIIKEKHSDYKDISEDSFLTECLGYELTFYRDNLNK